MENEIKHYGVPGMKWRNKKQVDTDGEDNNISIKVEESQEKKTSDTKSQTKLALKSQTDYAFNIRVGTKRYSTRRMTFDRKKFLKRFSKGV